MKRSKAQILNFGFIIAIVLLVAIIISVTVYVLRFVPELQEDIQENKLQAVAMDLGNSLIKDPGYPKDWSSAPTRVGLAKYNSYSLRTEPGELSLSKIDYVNDSMAYNTTKDSLGLENYDFKLTIINSSGDVLLDKYEPLPSTSTSSVILRRFAIVNSHAVNITIQVW